MIVKQDKPTHTEWTRVAFAELQEFVTSHKMCIKRKLVFYYNNKQFHLFVCDLII